MPTNTAIFLRVHVSTEDGKRHFHFYPRSPAVYEACGQLRVEYPIARYYSTNTLVVSGAMLEPAVLGAFMTARKVAVEHVTRIRVSHRVSVPARSKDFHPRYIFNAKVGNSEDVVITTPKVCGSTSAMESCFDVGGQQMACLCTFDALAAKG